MEEEDACKTTAANGLLPARETCQKMADKIEAVMTKQQECQRSLEMLAEEQEAFLRDMRSFAHAQGLAAELPGHETELPPQPANGTFHGKPNWTTKRTCTFDDSTAELEFLEIEEEPCEQERITMSNFHLKSQLSTLMHQRSLRGSSVVIFNDALGCLNRMRKLVERALSSRIFEPFMGIVILVNAVNIGWTIEMELQNQDTYVQTVIEIVILGLFWAELTMHFVVTGIRALKVKWNLFDFILNVVTTIVLIFAQSEDPSEEGRNTFADAMKQMVIMRMLRLLRLFRAMRLIQMSRSLWKLVEGLRQCMGTMVAALILICISLYVFGCFGAEIITKGFSGDDQIGGLVDSHFSSLPRIMLTLFQFIAMDSTAAIYVKLVHRSPFLFVYFLGVVVLVSIMLMNLITAVVVEDAITTATMDGEMKRHFLREKLRKLRPAFQELFKVLDSTNDGTVEIHDIVSAINGGISIPAPIEDLVTPSRMLDLFDLLDEDNSGELNESEFVDGLSCLALSEVPLETMQILHLLRSVRREVMRLRNSNRVSNAAGKPSGAASAALRRTYSTASVAAFAPASSNQGGAASAARPLDSAAPSADGAAPSGNGQGGLRRTISNADSAAAPSALRRTYSTASVAAKTVNWVNDEEEGASEHGASEGEAKKQDAPEDWSELLTEDGSLTL